MTAVSILIRGTVGYMLTDAGMFRADGTIIDLIHKVSVSETCPVAISISGVSLGDGAGQLIEEWLDEGHDYLAILAGLPGLAARIDAENVAVNPDVAAGPNGGMVRVHVVGFSPIDGRAHGFKVTSRPDPHAPDHPVLTVREVQNSVMPPVDRRLCEAIALSPIETGRAILEQQRLDTVDFGYSCVAGWGNLTTVTAAGAITQTILRWPDRVGERARVNG